MLISEPPATLDDAVFIIPDRAEKVLLATMAAMEHLLEIEFITGPTLLLAEGREMAAKQKAEGFHPTPTEIEWALHTIRREGM